MLLLWGLPLFESQVLRAYSMDLQLCCIFGKEQNSATARHVSAFSICISSHLACFRTSSLLKMQDDVHISHYQDYIIDSAVFLVILSNTGVLQALAAQLLSVQKIHIIDIELQCDHYEAGTRLLLHAQSLSQLGHSLKT